MESRAKIAGHSIHPMLIVIPIGMFIGSVIFDIAHLSSGRGTWAEMSYWTIAIGIIGGVAASIFGVIDWMAIPENTRARKIGLLHAIGNAVVLLLMAISWVSRMVQIDNPPTISIVLSFSAVALSVLTAWLGGELVGRLGVGVDDGANLDAPNSLTGKPAYRSRPSVLKGQL